MGHRDHFDPGRYRLGPMARRTVGGLVAGVALVALLAGCSSSEPADYDEAFRTDFVSRCREAYGRPGAEQVCGCWHDALVQAVPFEDLPPIDDLLADDFDIAPDRLPGNPMQQPLALLAGCVRFLQAEPTIDQRLPPPTLPAPPTTVPPTTVPL